MTSMRARAQALNGVAGKARKDRLLKRLVRFAKGSNCDKLGELSSYASYDQVAKGVRRMGGLSGRQESRDRSCAGPSDSPIPLRTTELTADASIAGIQSSQPVLRKNAAIENLQTFLEETAHDAAELDPDFNLAGILYVSKLLFMGTMPWANRVCCLQHARRTVPYIFVRTSK